MVLTVSYSSLLHTQHPKGERARLATSSEELEKDLHAETATKVSVEKELKEEKWKSQQMKVHMYTLHNKIS